MDIKVLGAAPARLHQNMEQWRLPKRLSRGTYTTFCVHTLVSLADSDYDRSTTPTPSIDRETHYFLKAILPILEDSCYDWIKPRYFDGQLASPAWIKKNLPKHLWAKRWTTKGKIELYLVSFPV